MMSRLYTIISLALISSLISAQSAYCVPAVPATQDIQQPDGTIFQARMWGDEGRHGWETVDGYTVVQDPTSRVWHYATYDSTGRAASTSTAVGTAAAPADLPKHQRPARSARPERYSRAAAPQLRSAAPQPVTGVRPLPVVMVNFNNTTPTYGAADFDHLLFGSGNKSLKDYYEEVSYGAFSVGPGASGVAGWYTASKTHDFYGQNDRYGYDKYPATLVRETVAAADADIDFSEYDTDGDCYVDAVIIIHQGSGEEAGGPDSDIWSHRWSLRNASYFGDGAGEYVTNDVAQCGLIIINDYVIQPETLWGQLQTVGVFAHEYGHVLGLPDLYDVDYSSSGIGNWGLMSGGSWNRVSRSGDSPAHMCAWSKYALGWIDPVVVTGPLTDEIIGPASDLADVYQFFPGNQIDSQEYFLIENRQKRGFDAGLPGAGLAIWHIDDGMASYANNDNSHECLPATDCAESHYRVALVQADGDWDLELGFNRGDNGDLFPGATANTFFGDNTDPGSLLYNGLSSYLSVTDIVESGVDIKASLGMLCSIVPSVSAGGTITPGTPTAIAFGDSITFAVTPFAGYQISQVYVDGQSVGAVAQYTFSDAQQSHAISAVFASTDQGGGGGGGGGCFISSLNP